MKIITITIWFSLGIGAARSAQKGKDECPEGWAPIGVNVDNSGAIELICDKACIKKSPEKTLDKCSSGKSCDYKKHQWVGKVEGSKDSLKLQCCEYGKVHEWLQEEKRKVSGQGKVVGKNEEWRREHNLQEVVTDIKHKSGSDYEITFARIECEDLTPPGSAAVGRTFALVFANAFGITFGTVFGVVFGTGSACFPPHSLVTTPTGLVPMVDVRPGTRVLTESDFGVLAFTEVKYFLHREPDTSAKFLSISTDSGKTLMLTADHLMYKLPCDSDPTTGYRQSIAAESAKPGDCVGTANGELLVIEKIVNITELEEKGIYAPVTESGVIVVDNVLVSCFVKSPDARINRAALRLMHKFQSLLAGIALNLDLVGNSVGSIVPLAAGLEYVEQHLASVIPTGLFT